MRSLFNYISVLVIPWAGYIVLKENGGISEKIIKNIINIWFVMGRIPTFINKDFLLFLVDGGRTTKQEV